MRSVKGGGGGRVTPLRAAPELHDITLEADVLHTLIVYPDLVLPSELCEGDFYAGANAAIFRAIVQLAADGEPVNTEHVRGAMIDAGTFAPAGGDEYLLRVTDRIPTRNVPFARLRKLARQRRLRDAATMLASRVGTDEQDRCLVAYEAAKLDLDSLEGSGRSPIAYRGTAEIFEPIEAPTWTVSELHVGPGRPAMLAGYGSSSKTLAAQSLALAVASGTPAWSHFPTALGEVRHLDYEQGFRATARRYQRLAAGHGIDRRRLADRLLLAVFPTIYLDSEGAVDAYARACDGASLVILDALRGATPSSDENDSSIRVCLDNLTRVSEKVGCAFLVLHHAGKPREGGGGDKRTRARGSSAIFDACGAVFTIEQTTDGGVGPRRVECTKPPADADGPPPGAFALAVEDVAIDGCATAGVRVVWEPITAESPLAKTDAQWTADVERMLEVLRAVPGAIQLELIQRSALGRTRAWSVLSALEHEGRVVCTRGPRNAKTYRLVMP